VNPDVAEMHAIELLKLAAIYVTLINVVTTRRRLAIVCGAMVLGSIVTSIGVIDWYHGGVDLVEGYRARWVGVYADPNHMAMNMGIVVPLAIAFLARKKTHWAFRILCAAAAILAVYAIVVSHSRGGFIGLICAMAMWTLREREHRLKALVASAILAVGLVAFAPKSFWARNETVAGFHEDASAMGRVYAWQVASRISLDKPMLGVGVGSFRYAWPLYAPPEARRAYVAHNIFLDVIGELGFVGLIAFLVFAGGAAGGAFSASSDKEHGWLSSALAAAMTGYLVCDLFSGYILSAHLYVLFGLAACAERIARGEALAPARESVPAPQPQAGPMVQAWEV
jgi:putative inorganic carbon (hco3(-)) transporter